MRIKHYYREKKNKNKHIQIFSWNSLVVLLLLKKSGTITYSCVLTTYQ